MSVPALVSVVLALGLPWLAKAFALASRGDPHRAAPVPVPAHRCDPRPASEAFGAPASHTHRR